MRKFNIPAIQTSWDKNVPGIMAENDWKFASKLQCWWHGLPPIELSKGVWITLPSREIGFLKAGDWLSAACETLISNLAPAAAGELPRKQAGLLDSACLTDREIKRPSDAGRPFSLYYIFSSVIGSSPRALTDIPLGSEELNIAATVLAQSLPFDLFSGNWDVKPDNIVLSYQRKNGGKKQGGYRCDSDVLWLKKEDDVLKQWLDEYEQYYDMLRLSRKVIMAAIDRIEATPAGIIPASIAAMTAAVPESAKGDGSLPPAEEILDTLCHRRAHIRKICDFSALEKYLID